MALAAEADFRGRGGRDVDEEHEEREREEREEREREEREEREREEREEREREERARGDAATLPPPTEPPSTPPPPTQPPISPPQTVPVVPPTLPPSPPKLVPGARLSARNVYGDMKLRSIPTAAIAYTPDYPLWSDASEKRRWMLLPAGSSIRTDDMDHWRFPIGTRFVKEFSIAGRPIETRVIEKVANTGGLASDFLVGAFIWLPDLSDAVYEKAGRDNAGGTTHDVPSQKQCMRCHESEPDAILGFSAVQLSKSGMLAALATGRLLSSPPVRAYSIPGDAVQSRALGFLHANCGHCHAAGGTGEDTLRLRFLPHEAALPIAETEMYRTTVGVLIKEWSPRPPQFIQRVVPGNPAQSALFYRMLLRSGSGFTVDQMPPIATELRDEEGIAAVRAWIGSLPTARSTQ